MPRILLVDDDRNILRSVGREIHFMRPHLPGDTISVESFERPEPALTRLKAGVFDLVIADYLMPTMSGAEFMRIAAEIQPRIPRILLSGFASVLETMEKVRLLDPIRVLAKPWNREELAEAVQGTLKSCRHSRQPLLGTFASLPTRKLPAPPLSH